MVLSSRGQLEWNPRGLGTFPGASLGASGGCLWLLGARSRLRCIKLQVGIGGEAARTCLLNGRPRIPVQPKTGRTTSECKRLPVSVRGGGARGARSPRRSTRPPSTACRTRGAPWPAPAPAGRRARRDHTPDKIHAPTRQPSRSPLSLSLSLSLPVRAPATSGSILAFIRSAPHPVIARIGWSQGGQRGGIGRGLRWGFGRRRPWTTAAQQRAGRPWHPPTRPACSPTWRWDGLSAGGWASPPQAHR